MRRNTVAAAIAVLGLLGLLAWTATRDRTPPAQISVAEKIEPGKTVEKGRRGKGKGGGGGAVAVEAAVARGATTTTDIRAIGSLRSDEWVQITSEIAGRIAEANFLEGGLVSAGDMLVKLDDGLAQAEVVRRQGAL